MVPGILYSVTRRLMDVRLLAGPAAPLRAEG